MKHFFLSILILTLAASESSAQWKDVFFPNPQAFGGHETSAFASAKTGGVYRYAPYTFQLWFEEDTGINPAYFPIVAFGSIGKFVLVDAGYRSTDDGSHWIPMHKFDFIPSWFANNDSLVFTGGIAGSGVWRSSDSGLDWMSADSGLTDLDVSCLVAENGTLFAGTTAGVFLSTNNGNHWTKTSFTTSINALAVLGTTIFASSFSQLHKSTDGGATWPLDTNGLQANGATITSIVTDGRYLFAGMYGGGVFLSTDSGQHWDTINSGLTNYRSTNYYGVTALGVFDTLLFAAASGNDNATFVRSIPEIIRSKDTTKGIVAPLPQAGLMLSAYPNPLSNSATLAYSIPKAGIVTIIISDALGRQIAVPFSGFKDAGTHTMNFDASTIPAGVYWCRLTNNGEAIFTKLTIQR